MTAEPENNNDGLQTQNEGSLQIENKVESLNSLFDDLSEQTPQEKAKASKLNKGLHYLNYAQIASSWASTTFLAIGIIASVVLYVRTLDNASILSSLPLCQHISQFVEGYENTGCMTLTALSAELDRQKSETESAVVQSLAAYVPVKLSAVDMRNSPEVQFIMEKTGDGRRSINDLLNAFSAVVNGGNGKQHIECGKLSVDEQGNLTTACSIYGAGLADSL